MYLQAEVSVLMLISCSCVTGEAVVSLPLSWNFFAGKVQGDTTFPSSLLKT